MKHFRQLVESRLADRLRKVLPEFKKKKYTDSPAVVSYVFAMTEDLYFHIVPRVDASARSFTVEICWMTTDRSPIWARLGTAMDVANDDGLCFAISHLWSQHDSSWVLAVEDADFWNDGQIRFRPEQLDAWIANHADLYPNTFDIDQRYVWPLVDDLVEKILRYAVPYFCAVAEERGLKPPVLSFCGNDNAR